MQHVIGFTTTETKQCGKNAQLKVYGAYQDVGGQNMQNLFFVLFEYREKDQAAEFKLISLPALLRCRWSALFTPYQQSFFIQSNSPISISAAEMVGQFQQAVSI